VAFQDLSKVVSQAASLEVFQVASQVGPSKEANGNSPRCHNSQHQDGLAREAKVASGAREAREASGARLQHNPSSLHLSSLHQSNLHHHRLHQLS